MKLYLVNGLSDMEVTTGNFVEVSYFYGAFSSQERADKIANDLRNNFKEHNEEQEITVDEVTVDEPNDDYHFFMNN